jgi:hypothetical protein
MLMLFAFFDQTIKAWQGSEKQVDAFREARAAMHYLARDFRSMVVTDQLPFLVNKSYIVPSQYDSNLGDSVFFISSQPEEAQSSTSLSDLCAVGYYMVHTRDGRTRSGNATGSESLSSYSSKLLRYFKSSNETWRNGTHGVAPLFQALGQTIPPPPSSPQQIAVILFSPADGSNLQNADEMIARNIVDFRVRLYDKSLAEIDASTFPYNEKPDVIEVEFYALNYDTASKFSNSSESANKQDWLDQNKLLFKQQAQRFVMRVEIPK